MSHGPPLTVLYVQNGSGTGGAGHSLEVLLGHLDPSRFRAVVWTGDEGPLVRRWQHRGARVVVRPMHLFEGLDTHFMVGALERDPGRWRRWVLQAINAARAVTALPGELLFLRRLRSGHGVFLVHINSIVPVTAGLAARLLGLPVVWHVREILADGLWPRLARSVILSSADQIVAISEAAARPFRGGRVPVRVVHNAVDLEGFDPVVDGSQVRRDLGLPPGAPVIGFVGKLFPSKGAFDLLRAAPLVRREVPEARFVVVGGSASEGTPRDARTWGSRLRRALGFGQAPDHLALLRAEAARLGLGDRLHFLGARHDVPRVLAAMDIVALPSRTEAFGRTIIESMAMARPVVSVAVDGIPELIRHGETGLLIPSPPRSEDLAGAIVSLLRDGARRTALGRAGRASVIERFSPADHAERIMATYEAAGRRHMGRQDQMPRAY